MLEDKSTGSLKSITEMMRKGKPTKDIMFDSEYNQHPAVSPEAIDDITYCIEKHPAKLYPMAFYNTMLGTGVISGEKPTNEEYTSIAKLVITLINYADKFEERGIKKLLKKLDSKFGAEMWNYVYPQINATQIEYYMEIDKQRTLHPDAMHHLLLKALSRRVADLEYFVIRVIKQYGYPDYNDHHLEDWCAERFALIEAMINTGQFLPGLFNLLIPEHKFNWYCTFAKLIAAQHPEYLQKNAALLRQHALNRWGIGENEFLNFFVPPDIDDHLNALLRVIDTTSQTRFALSAENHLLVEPVNAIPDNFLIDQAAAKQKIAELAANPNFKPQLGKVLDAGYTPLMALVVHGASEVAIDLVQHYSKQALLAQDACGNTVFHLAAFYRDNKVIDALFNRAAAVGLSVSEILTLENSRGFAVQRCYWADSSKHLKAPYEHARVIHLRDMTLDRSSRVNRKIPTAEESNLFDRFLLADLMLNNNAIYPYPLPHCERSRGPIPRRNKHIPRLPDQDNVELDLTKQQFSDFTPPQNTQQGSLQNNPLETALTAFWETDYGSYLQREFLSKLVKLREKKPQLKDQIEAVRTEFEEIIKNQINDGNLQLNNDILLNINNALRSKINAVMNRDWVKNPVNKVTDFFTKLGKVLLAAMLLFIPLLVPKYRYFVTDSSQKHLLRTIDNDMKVYTRKNLLVSS